ncbi:hypothetical protein DRQ53_00135 [bacterium]|nr:MAG: hypothetical protein DRQ53_00135 [bacterium]
MQCSISRITVAALLLLTPLLSGVVDSRAESAGFDQEFAWSCLLKQVEFGPRNPGSEGHEACLDWLVQELSARTDRLYPHTFVLADPYGEGSLQLTNLRASFGPTTGVRVAFAAHWDSRPRADREVPPAMQTAIDGANDGASGVAVLLALADWMAGNPPPIGVDLVFFDGEDYGMEGDQANYLIGSRRFAADFPDWRPAALVLLDMVGDRDLRIPMEGYSRVHSSELLQVVFNRALSLGLEAFEPVEGPAVLDDHTPFLARGIAAIDLIDMDYAPWHTLRDLPDQCDPDSLGQVGRLLVALIEQDFALGRGLRP